MVSRSRSPPKIVSKQNPPKNTTLKQSLFLNPHLRWWWWCIWICVRIRHIEGRRELLPTTDLIHWTISTNRHLLLLILKERQFVNGNFQLGHGLHHFQQVECILWIAQLIGGNHDRISAFHLHPPNHRGICHGKKEGAQLRSLQEG